MPATGGVGVVSNDRPHPVQWRLGYGLRPGESELSLSSLRQFCPTNGVNWAVLKMSHLVSIQRFVLRDEFMELCCLQNCATSVPACRCGKKRMCFSTPPSRVACLVDGTG